MKRLTILLLTLTLLLSLAPAALLRPSQGAEEPSLRRLGTSSPSAGGSVRRFASLADGLIESAPGNPVRWIDRAELPEAMDAFYDRLMEASDGDGVEDFLIDDTAYQLDGPLTDPASMQPGDFGWLQEVDTIFAAFLVTTLTLDRPWSEEEELYLTSAIRTAFSAFDRDCPEVFWLTGESSIRSICRQSGSTYTYFLFFPTRCEGPNLSFDLRDPDYPDAATIRAAIRLRETSVETILATVPQGDRRAQVAALNTWLIEHNEYNTAVSAGRWYGSGVNSPPWECISALAGSTGSQGPVCEGYARALKLLCDRLDIPCVLVDGRASYLGGARIGHMWNYIQMEDGNWYAADLTWNDPAGGVSGALSGRERDLYLLVGSDTVLQNYAFGDCHLPENLVTYGGFAFLNGPQLHATAYAPEESQPASPVFQDVHSSDWFSEAVSYAARRGFMNGTGDGSFQPGALTTRGTIAMLLYNMEQRPAAGEPVFQDTPATAWYTPAVTWAAGHSLVNGYGDGRFGPDDPITREQMAVFLYQYASFKGLDLGESASLASFSDAGSVSFWAQDAMEWAVCQGLFTGTGDGRLDPLSTADRAQIAALLMRFCQKTGL